MKKVVLALVLTIGLGFSINMFAKSCSPIPATRENAGGIMDWCDKVSCRKCTDADPLYNGHEYVDPGVIIYTVECEANC